jgi:hypothetical protein
MRLFTIFALIFFSIQIFACNRAYQYRLFPLAVSENEILFLEIELIRDARDKNLWIGNANIIKLSENSSTFVHALDSITLSSKNYSNDLNTVFVNATKIIDTSIYKSVNIEDIFLCRHSPKCREIALKRESKDSLLLIDSQKCSLLEIPKTENAYKELIAAGGLGEPFNINSIRELQFANKKIMIVNVGTGEKESSDFKNLIKDQMQYEKEPLFPELTLYHGFCFDMIVFLQ